MGAFLDYLKAFLVGGTICLIGQILIDKTKMTPGRILVTFVVAGAALSAIGIYEPLVDFAGAGASVPITGFGHLLAQGAKKGVGEDGLLGAFTGPLTAASAGVTSAVVFGYICSLVSKPKDKT
ncbi:MAG: stage V sporulation protein AE [Ruminococcaceae bacterium]|nr:stage V sporulation protein AE [Oscillospiraceae bacterium]